VARVSATQFRDRVLVTRGGGGGTQDPTTGAWTPSSDAEVIYEGPANVQAGGLLLASRRAVSEPLTSADGLFILPRGRKADALKLQPGDLAHISYQPVLDGTTLAFYAAEAEVTFVRPEDRTALVRYR
jgi:hypothetical protein